MLNMMETKILEIMKERLLVTISELNSYLGRNDTDGIKAVIQRLSLIHI